MHKSITSLTIHVCFISYKRILLKFVSEKVTLHHLTQLLAKF